MNLIESEWSFFPDELVPVEDLLGNDRCLRIVLAWLQAGDVVEDGAQWLVDACAYQELQRGQELQALCVGYLQLYRVLAAMSQSSARMVEQVHHTVLTYCKLHLISIGHNLSAVPEVKALPTLRNAAEAYIGGEQCTERQLFFRCIINSVLPDGWLNSMANAQRTMWLDGDEQTPDAAEQAAEQIGKLWQYMFDILLPQDMQTAFFCENCLRGTYFALCSALPSERVTWHDITDSFLNTIETE